MSETEGAAHLFRRRRSKGAAAAEMKWYLLSKSRSTAADQRATEPLKPKPKSIRPEPTQSLQPPQKHLRQRRRDEHQTSRTIRAAAHGQSAASPDGVRRYVPYEI
ncbi:hypothetical protein MHYP_G00182970 [Metynnis hypsauchen]